MIDSLTILIIAALALATIYSLLSLNIIRLRWELKVSFGDGGNEELRNAIRAHGNFAEYAPMGLLLLLLLHLKNGPVEFIACIASMLLWGRIFHAIGMYSSNKKPSLERIAGIALTLVSYILMIGFLAALCLFS